MLPLRVLRATATRRLIPATTTSSYIQLYSTKEKAPHLPNVTSTLGTDVPNVGSAPAPPELLHTVDPNWKPLDAGTGEGRGGEVTGSQKPGHGRPNADNTDWRQLRIEPKLRSNEDEKTMRARLVYQSRKRGILETDLLLSTFADAELSNMSRSEMQEYDSFLDENDWDIYYWCTQEPPHDIMGVPGSKSPDIVYTEPTIYNTSTPPGSASPTYPDSKMESPAGVHSLGSIEQPAWNVGAAEKADDRSGRSLEWAQTVGTTKQPYREVPTKWKNSAILTRLRKHVKSRSAGAEGAGTGLGRMPAMKSYEGYNKNE